MPCVLTREIRGNASLRGSLYFIWRVLLPSDWTLRAVRSLLSAWNLLLYCRKFLRACRLAQINPTIFWHYCSQINLNNADTVKRGKPQRAIFYARVFHISKCVQNSRIPSEYFHAIFRALQTVTCSIKYILAHFFFFKGPVPGRINANCILRPCSGMELAVLLQKWLW